MLIFFIKPHLKFNASVALLALLLTGCGGGGGGNGGRGSSVGTVEPVWQEGQFEPASEFANRCENPRLSGDFPDREGSLLTEKFWLRSWVHETYLWFDEIDDVDPEPLSMEVYFNERLRTDRLTPVGNELDPLRFRFMMDTEEFEALSESGTSLGYGVRWLIQPRTPPRSIRVAFVEPDSPADEAGLSRGDHLERVDGETVESGEAQVLNNALSPQEEGESHDFEWRDRDSGELESASMAAQLVSEDPVPVVKTLDTAQGQVGYLLFKDHSAVSEEALRDAVAELSQPGVIDLVLDLRYNGGGFLNIANHLAFMIAGPAQTDEKIFEQTEFNEKHPDTNPVTGQPIEPMPFLSETTGRFVLPEGEPLPSLNLSRLFVLTGDNTCSASEAIINGLNGIDVEVIQIGNTTCGKPFGFFPEDNCGTTYAFTQFRGVNDKGFGDYPDGFSPIAPDQEPVTQAQLPGCRVADDLSRDLGDPREARLAAAMTFYREGVCPESAEASAQSLEPAQTPPDGYMPRPAFYRNRALETN